MATKNAMDMTDDEFETAIRRYAHADALATEAAQTEHYLVQKGFKEATPKTPADRPNAKPFSGADQAWLAREFPDHAQYQSTNYGLKETK